MFLRKLRVHMPNGEPVPLRRLDSFAMRGFTGEAAFDDTLPVADGLLEAGLRVDVPALTISMEAWFQRKGWLAPEASLQVSEQEPTGRHPTG